MKNHFQITFVFLLFYSLSNAQQASRFPIKTSSVWRINYEYSCMDVAFSHVNADEEYKYFIDGDSIIGIRTYFKLYKTGILFLDSPFRIEHKYIGAIRDSADKYFFIKKDDASEALLYDFSLNIGDSVYVKDYGMKYPIDIMDTLENGRKRFILNIITVNCGSANTIIEGIGWLGGLLEGNSCSGHPGVRGSYLVCYSEDGETVYTTDHTRCGDPVLCSTDITSDKHQVIFKKPEIIILPDGFLRVNISDLTGGLYDLEIYNIMGVKIYHHKSKLNELINIREWESGTYILRVRIEDQSFTSLFGIL
jgi:hypothetical protein